MPPRRCQSLLFIALTAIFVGYLSVWLPGPAAGLRFLGVEMGEWIKFLGVGQSRNWFYLPPITLGLMMALLTVAWPNGRWQTWVMRGLAVAVGLLAFPALEDLRGPSQEEYLIRVLLIGVVGVVALLSGLPGWKRTAVWHTYFRWLLMMILGVMGTLFPLWIYLQVRPLVSQVLGLPVGIGLGVWLNGAGHLLVTAVSLTILLQSRKTKSSISPLPG